MKFMNIGLEEEQEDQNTEEQVSDVQEQPNETEKAIEMVNNEDSTEPAVQIKIANYKDELAALKSGDDAADSSEEPEESDELSTDESEEGTEESSDESEESEEDTDSTDEEEVKESEDDSNDSEEDSDTEDTESPEEINDSELNAAQEGFDVLSNLYKLKGVLDKAKERNSFTPIAMETFNIALERNKKLLGVAGGTRYQTPSVEGFDNFNTRKLNIEQALVAVENFVNDIWEGIKRFFKAIWDWFASFFSKTRKSTANARNDIKRLRAEAKRVESVEKKQNELSEKDKDKNRQKIEDGPGIYKVKDAANLIPMDINDESYTAVLEGANRVMEISKNFVLIQDGFDHLLKFSKEILSLVERTDYKSEAAFQDLAKLVSEKGNVAKFQKTTAMSPENSLPDLQVGTGFELLVSKELPFNKRFYLKRLKNSNIGDFSGRSLDDIKAQHFGISINNDKRELVVQLLPNSEQINKCINTLETFVKEMETVEKAANRFNRETENLNKILQSIDKDSNPAMMKLIVNEFSLALTLITKISQGGFNKLYAYCYNYRQKLDHYIQVSSKQF